MYGASPLTEGAGHAAEQVANAKAELGMYDVDLVLVGDGLGRSDGAGPLGI